MALIQTLTPTGTATASFTNIPQTYNHLLIMGVGATTSATAAQYVAVKFNTDGGTNYAAQTAFAHNTTLAAQGTYGVVPTTTPPLQINGTSGPPANSGTQFKIEVDNYTQTTFLKTYSTEYGVPTTSDSTGLYDIHGKGFWASTAAITQIDLIVAAGNWATGSTIYLYGIT